METTFLIKRRKK